jgi:uncharacterized iron-regulated membrane protein
LERFIVTIYPPAARQRAALYATLWRWHFYAGLFVIPFVLILSLTGAFYLFKPQVDRWEERAFHGASVVGAVSADVQADAALNAFPGARLHSYRLPEKKGDAALIHLALAGDAGMRDVFVTPQGKIAGSLDPDMRLMAVTSEIHASVLAGQVGRWLVELAASWAIVMIITGLYLWWPRGRIAGVLWPRRNAFLRDLHAVTGFWVSGLALVLLISGMPWAGVWGDAFKMVRTEMGWVQGKQDWTSGGQHAEHDHDAMMAKTARGDALPGLSTFVDRAISERLAFPVIVKPPANTMVWTVKSEAQDRSLRATITYDMVTGKQASREDFADRHPIDRAVGYGIAWHEGQLFGWVNQAIGVMTAMALITLSVSGFMIWRRRRPDHGLGAPPAKKERVKLRGVAIVTVCLAALLPLLAASLILLAVFDRLVLPRWPQAARWLGAG